MSMSVARRKTMKLKLGLSSSTKSSKSIKLVIPSSARPDCTWHLHASSVQGSSLFRIKTYQFEHSCFGINHQCIEQVRKPFVVKKFQENSKEKPSYHLDTFVK